MFPLVLGRYALNERLNEMTPDEYTAEVASNPHTPALTLQDIAKTRPDLRPMVAANPAAYPDLVNWLAGLGDPQVDAAIAQRNVSPQAVTDPVNGSVPTQDNAPTSAAPLAPVPLPDGHVAPTPSTGTTADAGSEQAQSAGDAGRAPRSRRGLWIGLGVGALALVAAGAFALNHFVFSKISGADSPEAAANNLVMALTESDEIALYGALSPAEREYFGDVMGQFSTHFDDASNEKWAEHALAFYDSFSFEASSVNYEVEDLGDDVARITIAEGEFTLDADGDKVADAVNNLLVEVEATSLGELITQEGGTFPSPQEVADDVTTGIAEEFPVTFTAEDLIIPASELGSGLDSFSTGGLGVPDVQPSEDLEDVAFALVAVKEDGSWFISPQLTAADLQVRMMGQAPDYGALPAAVPADSPEEAAEQMVRAAFEGLDTLDFSAMAGHFVTAERRAAGLVPTVELSAEEQAEYDEIVSSLSLSDVSYSVDRVEGDTAYLILDNLAVDMSVEGLPYTFTMSNDCAGVNASGMTMSMCMRDIPALQELGLSDLRLIAREENGGWVVSSGQSSADSLGVVGSQALRLYEEGKLTDEQWWMDNLGILSQYGAMMSEY